MNRQGYVCALIVFSLAVSVVGAQAPTSVPLWNWQVPERLLAPATTETAAPLMFVAVTPCRVVDTRNGEPDFAPGFGRPSLIGFMDRTIIIPQNSRCGVPAAAAYSLNFTVQLPPGRALNYLSAWPAGSEWPGTSILNALNGGIVSNSAIVPAGVDGAIKIRASEATDVFIDINGYYTAGGTLSANSVNTQQLADGAVTASKLAVNSLTAAKIASGAVVKSINSLRDDVTLAAGSNITLTPNGNTLTISSAGSGNDNQPRMWAKGAALKCGGRSGTPPDLYYVSDDTVEARFVIQTDLTTVDDVWWTPDTFMEGLAHFTFIIFRPESNGRIVLALRGSSCGRPGTVPESTLTVMIHAIGK